MPRHYDAHEAPYQISPEILSPDRPPQLNETVNGCGCRCGDRGVAEEGDGGSNDGDNTSTLVGSEIALDEEFPPSSDGPEQHVNVGTFRASPAEEVRQMNEVQTRFGVFENGAEGFRPTPHMVAMEESLDDGMADSMNNEPPHSSDDQSAITSDARSVRCMSPGPGIGGWIAEEFQLNDCHFIEYHFLVKPLRLTPQHRYCRGLVSSHMVVPDEGFYGHDG
ncbi:hypothetical protein K505DRAFT_419056 [Melanomma pulvis-pyrius CBS 109.77]|uniref:Uncharacterized protein n=1 Tax=Melanomma pulvis-pyrius CBS 109.77 TaxID=1314802 RepID=A0A6A6X5M8_9PLEO|nr:hypothetical protein K505DRAFT_419056 [Melanomma pulvis-pyrius CBS 109.77]